MSKHANFDHRGSMRCQCQSFPNRGNFLEVVSCLWLLVVRNEDRRHTFQISISAKSDQNTSHLSIPISFPWNSSFLSLDNCSSVSTSETRFKFIILIWKDTWRLLQTDLECSWLEAGEFASTTVAAQACLTAGGNIFVQVLCRWTCASCSFLHQGSAEFLWTICICFQKVTRFLYADLNLVQTSPNAEMRCQEDLKDPTSSSETLLKRNSMSSRKWQWSTNPSWRQ